MNFSRSTLICGLLPTAFALLTGSAVAQMDHAPPPAAELPDATTLISAALDQMSAAERRETVKSISLKGTMGFDPPMPEEEAGPQVESFSAKLLLPNKYHLTASFTGGETAIAAHNGEHGWQSDPGDPSLSLMDESEAGMFALIIPHSLLLAIDEMYPVRTTEEEIEIEGVKHFRISLAPEEGEIGIDVFVRADTGQFSALESSAGGAPVRVTITEWESNNGLSFPAAARLDLGMGEMGPTMALTYSEVSINDVDEAVFAMPEEVKRQIGHEGEGGEVEAGDDDDGGVAGSAGASNGGST